MSKRVRTKEKLLDYLKAWKKETYSLAVPYLSTDDIDIIIEALEELHELEYKNGQHESERYHRGFYDGYEKGSKDGSNKAIDDCLKIITECVWKDAEMLEEIIKQLKAGGENDS